MTGVNLMPAARVLARRRRRRIRLWAMVVATACVLGAVPMTLELSRHRQVQALGAERDRTTAEIEKVRGNLNQLGIDARQLESEIARAEALRTKRPWARLIGLIASSMPDEVWLTAIATDPPTARRGTEDKRTKDDRPAAPDKPAEATVVILEAPQVVTIDGYAIEQQHIWEFVARLSGAGALGSVRLQKSIVEPVLESTAVHFQIVCDWTRGA
ncbi:MAG: hypothetical protein HOP29_02495 [Phycisphaerales bacterium]|nr:hypothetical protein [Phycisphaerales bacterium]